MEILYSRALTHFIAAFEHGNLRLAARAVGVTQPAVTKSIQKLEDHIGVPLFERAADGVRPTEVGHMLRLHAQGILNEARFVEMEISARVEGRQGLIKMGVGVAWSLSVFPDLLERFCRRFPQIDVEVETGVTDHLLPQLQSGDIDLWLGSLHGIDDSEEIAVQNVGQAELLVYARPDHPLASLDCVRTRDLEGASWATFTHDRKGMEMLNRYFQDAGSGRPRLALRLSSLVTMFRVAAGSDLLVMVADTLQPEALARGLVVLKLERPIWSFATGLAYRRNTAHLAAIQFIKSALTQIDQSPPESAQRAMG